MTEDEFWDIIDQTWADTFDKQVAALTAVLDARSSDDIIAFQTIYCALLDRAYRWDLWGAAYLINGGCSDDGFDYFCDWLISRGRAVFESAVANPENLVDTDLSGELQFEEFRHIANDVYRSKFGDYMDFSLSAKGEPVGEPFDEDALENLFPRLSNALFGEKVPAPNEPHLSSQEIEKRVDDVLAELVGKRLTSIVPVLTRGPIRKVAGISFYFALGRPRLEAPAWTIERTDAGNLSTTELVEAANSEGQHPADEARIAVEKERLFEATQEVFADMRKIRMTVKSAKRFDSGHLQLEISNAPSCKSIILHGVESADGNPKLGVLLKQDDDRYYLTANGVTS